MRNQSIELILIVSRIYIVEHFKEFYANDVCKSHPDLCEWVKERVRENNDWIEGTQYIGTITMNQNQSKTDRLFFVLL